VSGNHVYEGKRGGGAPAQFGIRGGVYTINLFFKKKKMFLEKCK